jgi:hypothetical protein
LQTVLFPRKSHLFSTASKSVFVGSVIPLLVAVAAARAQMTDSKWLPGIVHIRLKATESAVQDADTFFAELGVNTSHPDHYPDRLRQSLTQHNPHIYLYASSGPSALQQWRRLFVPVGSENAWVETFRSRKAFVETADLVPNDATLSAGDSSTQQLIRQASGIQAGCIRLHHSSSPPEVLKSFEKFVEDTRNLGSALPNVAIVYPDERTTPTPNREIIVADHLRTNIRKGWQRLFFDVLVVSDDAKKGANVQVIVTGSAASGLGEKPPDLDLYNTDLLPKFAEPLQQYCGQLRKRAVDVLKAD